MPRPPGYCWPSKPKTWVVQNKTALFIAIIMELGGNAHLFFEGDLRGFRLTKIEGASAEETPILELAVYDNFSPRCVVLGPSIE